jgi:hypothetical protein
MGSRKESPPPGTCTESGQTPAQPTVVKHARAGPSAAPPDSGSLSALWCVDGGADDLGELVWHVEWDGVGGALDLPEPGGGNGAR